MIEIEQYIWGFTPEGEVALIYVMINGRGQKVFLTNAAAGVVNEKIISDYKVDDYLRSRDVEGKVIGCGVADAINGKLWEARTEVNRVVMSYTGDVGRGEQVYEVVYDFDDDGVLEITLQSHTTESVNMGMTNTKISESLEEVEVGENLIYERHLNYQVQ